MKSHIGVAITSLAAGLLLGFFMPHCGNDEPVKALPSATTHAVAKHDVPKTSAPVKALDKAELRRQNVIAKPVEQDKAAEVLTVGKVSGCSGTRNIAAVLDTKTGDTKLVEKRPVIEWMNRGEAGIGYGWGSDGEVKAVKYEHTFLRIWELYSSVEARAEQTGKSTDWSAMLWLSYRW